MANKAAVILKMNLEGEHDFASSIEKAIETADSELARLDETIRSVDDLKPDCDKLDYALAASSGAICGLIDIFLVDKPGESPIGDVTDKWFEDRVADFAKLNGWQGESAKTPIKFLEEKYKVPYDQTGRGVASCIYGLTPSTTTLKITRAQPDPVGSVLLDTRPIPEPLALRHGRPAHCPKRCRWHLRAARKQRPG